MYGKSMGRKMGAYRHQGPWAPEEWKSKDNREEAGEDGRGVMSPTHP